MPGFYDAGVDFPALVVIMEEATCLESVSEGVVVVGGWVVEHLVVEEKGSLWGGGVCEMSQ